jgi:hypothetical protein
MAFGKKYMLEQWMEDSLGLSRVIQLECRSVGTKELMKESQLEQ